MSRMCLALIYVQSDLNSDEICESIFYETEVSHEKIINN